MLGMLKRLLIFLLFIVVVLVIWVLLPLGDSGFEIAKSNYFLSSFINIHSENAQIFDEVVNFKFQEKYTIKSKMVRKIVKTGGRFLLPLNVCVMAEPKEGDSEDFNYLVVIKSARLRRIIQIHMAFYRLTPDFKEDYISKNHGSWRILEPRDKDDDLMRMAWYEDTIIVSSDSGMFESVFKAGIKNVAAVSKASDDSLLSIFINNEQGLFEYYVNELKDEASYNVFRSADQLRKIKISLMSSSDADFNHQGMMIFEFKAGCDLASSKKDVRFFMQLIKRVMDANSYVFKYTLKENINLVKVEYNLQKIRRKN